MELLLEVDIGNLLRLGILTLKSTSSIALSSAGSCEGSWIMNRYIVLTSWDLPIFVLTHVNHLVAEMFLIFDTEYHSVDHGFHDLQFGNICTAKNETFNPASKNCENCCVENRWPLVELETSRMVEVLQPLEHSPRSVDGGSGHLLAGWVVNNCCSPVLVDLAA